MASKRKELHKTLGQAPGTVVYVGNKQASELFVDVFNYSKELFQELELKTIEEAFTYKNTDTVSWVNVNGLRHVETLKTIGSFYDLHPLLIEDIANTHQAAKLDDYDTHLFIVLKMLRLSETQELVYEHVSLVLGKNYVLSFQEADGDVFDGIRNRLRIATTKIRTLGEDYLLYALMDAVVDHYFYCIESIGEKIEALEERLFDSKDKHNWVFQLQQLKKEILKMRRAIFPLREVILRIEKSEHRLISKHTQLYLRDLYDHINQITDNLESYREMAWGLLEMYMSTVSNTMNEIMKVLTIIASIFIPLTFLAGIYGMNFEYIPELQYKYGYFVLWGVMAVIFVGLLYYFKRKRWL